MFVVSPKSKHEAQCSESLGIGAPRRRKAVLEEDGEVFYFILISFMCY
jgi:hypothetical protein